MTDPNDNDDPESALASLFERSASALTAEDRTRLARRARDIGDARPRSLSRAGFFIWGPVLAAAAAVAYLAVPMRHVARDAGGHAATASAPAAAESTAPRASAATTTAPASDDPEDDDPVFAVLGGEPSDVEPLDLGPLMVNAPRSERGASPAHGAVDTEPQQRRSPE